MAYLCASRIGAFVSLLPGQICAVAISLSSASNAIRKAIRGCGYFLGLSYAAIPRLCRYSTGLRKPSESLIRFALYQRMYESTVSMN